MAYYHGPDEWHRMKSNVISEFKNGKPDWAELRSEKVTLRLSLKLDTAEASVQSGIFSVGENNTFLVLHTGEPSMAQKIIPLGIFDFSTPSASRVFPSVLLLQGNPQLMDRINKEAASGQRIGTKQ
jgi:hypothetical protein